MPFNRLKIKIPETLAAFDDFYWIGYDYEKGESYVKDIEFWASTPTLNDRSKIEYATKHRGFVDSLIWADTLFYKHDKVDGDNDPAVIKRSWGSFPVNENIEVMSWEKLKQNYAFGPNGDGIMQRFVYSPSHKATLYRLVFNNPNNSDKPSNYGFCLTNKKNYWHPKCDIEVRTTHISETVNSFTVYKMSGKSLQDFEMYSQNLCNFIERSY